MLSYTYGTYTSSLPTHQTVPTRAAWQCDHSKHTGAQRYSVRRRTRLQVARVAESFWQLAHHLHAHEPLGQERSARPSVRTASAKGDCEGHHQGSFTGQHLRQGASRRHGRGQKNGPQSIGKSRGGWTTKLHMVAADDRTPLAFSLSPGQAHDGPEGRKLLNRLGPQRGNPPLVMDRAYSGDQTRRLAFDMGFTPVVPPLKSRVDPWEYDKELYKRRNEVERLFRRLKGYRRVFTRYDKLDALYAGFVLFAIIFDALRSVNRP